METAALLKKVRKIEIKTKGLSKHLFSGEYHSAFKGRGMAFSEVRSYQYGDDVRNIDWNVTARTNAPHVKVFEEERELTILLVVDVSQSSFFGTRRQTKLELMIELCAVLAFSAISNNDKVGLALFSDKIEKFIPPKKGRQHTLRILRELIDFQPQHSKTNLAVCLEYVNNVIKKRSVCFVLSDFLSANYEQPLRIVGKRHDLIGVQIADAMEEVLPNVGMMHIRDAETGQVLLIDTASAEMRQQHSRWFRQHSERFSQLFAKVGADTIRLRSGEEYIHTLLQFFKQRKK